MAKKMNSDEAPFKPINPNKKRTGRPSEMTRVDWTTRFLENVMSGMSVRDATADVGIHFTVPYDRRKRDENFRAAWQEAAEIGTELLEQEAQRRAFHGTLKPVFNKGVQCGTVREYSDLPMIFLLKARKPSVYREGFEDGQAGRGTVINVNVVQVDSFPTGGSPPTLEIVDVEGHQQDHTSLPEAAEVPGE